MALVAAGAHCLGFAWKEAFLLGAVISSTDAAAVFSVLRNSGLQLRHRPGATLELESGLNDPMAVILSAELTHSLVEGTPLGLGMLLKIPLQLAIGTVCGLAIGLASRRLLRGSRLPAGGLYPWFGQVTMFLVFGLLVFPSRLWAVAGTGLAIGLLLALVARPLAAMLCLLPFRFPWRESAFLGWVGLRGAVPIILAIFPVLAGLDEGKRLFDMVFFVVVVSALVPGATVAWVARRLGLASEESPPPPAVLEISSARTLNGEILSFYIHPAVAVAHAAVADVPFPSGASALLIVRGGELIAARGDTLLLPGDHVHVFCRREDREFVELLFGRPEE